MLFIHGCFLNILIPQTGNLPDLVAYAFCSFILFYLVKHQSKIFHWSSLMPTLHGRIWNIIIRRTWWSKKHACYVAVNNIYSMCTMECLLRREGLKDAMTFENQEHPGGWNCPCAWVRVFLPCGYSAKPRQPPLLPLVSLPMDDTLRRLTTLGSTIKMSLSVHSAEGSQDVLSVNVGSGSFYMFFLVSSHLVLRKFGMKIEWQKSIVCYCHYTMKDHCNFS